MARIRPQSDRRAAEQDDYDRVRQEVSLRDYKRSPLSNGCRARGALEATRGVTRAETLCAGPVDPHHIWPTGKQGPRLDPANIVCLCRKHHDYVHAHREWSEPRDLLRPHGPVPAVLP
jgi:hypothetical protein